MQYFIEYYGVNTYENYNDPTHIKIRILIPQNILQKSIYEY